MRHREQMACRDRAVNRGAGRQRAGKRYAIGNLEPGGQRLEPVAGRTLAVKANFDIDTALL
jgi:hypothetical protein